MAPKYVAVSLFDLGLPNLSSTREIYEAAHARGLDLCPDGRDPAIYDFVVPGGRLVPFVKNGEGLEFCHVVGRGSENESFADMHYFVFACC